MYAKSTIRRRIKQKGSEKSEPFCFMREVIISLRGCRNGCGICPHVRQCRRVSAFL